MRLVYISGPYRAKSEIGILNNIRAAETIALKYWGLGFSVICPHKNTAFLGGTFPDHVWLDGDLEMLRRSDIVVMIRGWENSVGATVEHALANQLGKEIVYEW
jgi:hypothetical protein